MGDITLKRIWVGQRIYFGKGSQFYISNYALDLSGMTATVVGIDFEGKHGSSKFRFDIRVRLDSEKYLKDLSEWYNTLEFYGSPLNDSTIYDLAEQAYEVPHDHNAPYPGLPVWYFHLLTPYDPVTHDPPIYTITPF